MKRILIVEDYYVLADVESLLCTMEGYDVRVARNGAEGLAVLKDFHPDLILLDIVLPGGMDGIDFLGQIGETGEPVPRILVVSARLDDDTKAQLDSRGVDTLAKPFKVSELASRMQAILG